MHRRAMPPTEFESRNSRLPRVASRAQLNLRGITDSAIAHYVMRRW
jgi:hypothetical protein